MDNIPVVSAHKCEHNTLPGYLKMYRSAVPLNFVISFTQFISVYFPKP